MDITEFESKNREIEIENATLDLSWRQKAQIPMDKQEVIRRAIEACLTAAKACKELGIENSSTKKVINEKLKDMVKKLGSI